ncbi:TPA: hypothetical protein NJ357_004451 [Vibrio parahaemolyticus]|nr:hypothetical protein [Vibrio parahaemolyticus]MBE3696268.1 hypothetical protein [Vibrio parahaemolyticus]HCE3194668.1 hypothetical protein [Vibrio parahaemolyticus]HCG7142056.1 hypothetical protein [Vibrio parahaemolyticus]HCG8196502.1 hypothetical protein [Vibrio parahaemolyticus]
MSFLAKSVLWTLCTGFFGLLQLVFVVGTYLLTKNGTFPIDKILLDGSLLFFCTAVVAAVTTDHHLGEYKVNKILSFILYTLVPIIILIVAIGIFSNSLTISEAELDKEFFLQSQVALILTTVAYSFCSKSMMFYSDDKKGN